MEDISPKFQMQLVIKVYNRLYDLYKNIDSVELYIKKWYREDKYRNENFHIFSEGTFGRSRIDLKKTLGRMSFDMLLKIAIDIDIETPNFIPAIPIYRNELKANYTNARQIFESALKKVELEPDVAVGLANSALESVIKEILTDDRFSGCSNEKDTLSKQIENICKAFNIEPNNTIPKEIRDIASGLMKVSKSIEDIRSTKSSFHGKTNNDYIISESNMAYFIVNATTTVGLFLLSYYKENFPKQQDLPL